MLQSTINSEYITGKERIQKKNVTSLTVTNTGASDITITMNNVAQVLPKYDPVNQYSPVFQIDGDGTYSDVDITFDFVDGNGTAILRTRQVTINNTCN